MAIADNNTDGRASLCAAAPHREPGGRASRRVSLSGVTPGTVDHQIQCIASPYGVHPFGGTSGHARLKRKSRAAPRSSVTDMYELPERILIARELAAVFLDGPWTVEGLSERGAGSFDRWPGWITTLAMTVTAVYRSPPADEPERLVALVESFLTQRSDDAQSPPPRPISLVAELPPNPPRRWPTLRHDWPVARIESVSALAERLELSAGPAGVARRRPRPGAHGHRRTASQLPLPQRAARRGNAAGDRGAEGAAQGDPAMDPA